MFQEKREDFPTLCGENPPVYLDNACMTLRPKPVIDAIRSYYEESPGCAGRSVHRYATTVSRKVVNCRSKMSKMFNANSPDEIIFTKNATHSLNQVAKGLSWNKGDVVLTTDREHNSNLVPWLQLEQEQGIDHRVVRSNTDNTFDIEAFEEACANAGDKLRMVSLSHVGNLDGVATPVKQAAKIAKDHGAMVCIDGAQSTPHMKVDVQDLGVDFMAFSIHKMMGPSGMGGLWGKMELLENMRSIQSGGSTVETSNYDSMVWSKPPARFEGGLGNYAGILGTNAAIDYISDIDLDMVHEHEVSLNRVMTSIIKDVNGIEIIGPEDPSLRGGICSLLFETIDAHDIAILLDEAADVMVRSGMHCVHSWFNDKGIDQGSLRASAYLYNTEAEVRLFAETLVEAVEALG
ncbi:MAG: aminotransferase class V-fold PLP-dependent enzyme [Euryarchaeota archaeon]|jgi:cysteine desulfurase/selenocysteine lyase|nr:cysteine desulfurase [Euryarchaeota archaeon]NCF96398.1 aminotransferase class V-fold PLP-dependent enzyme [Euryarchaeota archaeon]